MRTRDTYELDLEQLRLNLYRLVCLFSANKEIRSRSDPAAPSASAQLEERYFPREMAHLLLNVAIGLRVLDDQMRYAEPSERRDRYLKQLEAANRKHKCMLFDDDMGLRDVYNKIIHASVAEPHVVPAQGGHLLDDLAEWDRLESGRNDPVDPVQWRHLSGNIRLGGRHGAQQWWHLLNVEIFAASVHETLLGLETVGTPGE